jgi:hypothetical protein
MAPLLLAFMPVLLGIGTALGLLVTGKKLGLDVLVRLD